jgi:hypothetical protein
MVKRKVRWRADVLTAQQPQLTSPDKHGVDYSKSMKSGPVVMDCEAVSVDKIEMVSTLRLRGEEPIVVIFDAHIASGALSRSKNSGRWTHTHLGAVR